jgi:deoxyxylulose-5-phosphate synthase
LAAVLAAAAAFFAGIMVAAVVIAWPLEIKREIDLIELAKVTVLAIAAFVVKDRYDRRTRAKEGERGLIETVIGAAWSAATECQQLFRAAELNGTAIATRSREQLVRAFSQLDSEIVLLERLVVDSGLGGSDDSFVRANEELNDVILSEGLHQALMAQPRAEEAYRELRLALARLRRKIVGA